MPRVWRWRNCTEHPILDKLHSMPDLHAARHWPARRARRRITQGCPAPWWKPTCTCSIPTASRTHPTLLPARGLPSRSPRETGGDCRPRPCRNRPSPSRIRTTTATWVLFRARATRGLLKGVCLFDPLREDTPRRVQSLMERWPGRIVAMRVHETQATPESGGPIRNRDMKDPHMLACWKALTEMRVGIQMHFLCPDRPPIFAAWRWFPTPL